MFIFYFIELVCDNLICEIHLLGSVSAIKSQIIDKKISKSTSDFIDENAQYK